MSNQNAKSETLGQLKAQTALLTTLSQQLDRLARQSAPISPNYERPLSAYQNFDWQSIGAEPITSEDDGRAMIVMWNGHQFYRRFGTGKFGDAIWFSRAIGQSENGTDYARLITFKDRDVEPLSVNLPKPRQAQPIPDNPHWPAQPAQALTHDRSATIPTIKPRTTSPAIVAEPISNDPRLIFYEEAGKAKEQGLISHQKFNQLAKRGRESWAVAIEELRGCLRTAELTAA